MPGEPQAPEGFELSPWSGEFLDPGTEAAFREHIRPQWLKDTRRAFIVAGLFYLAFAVTDFLMLGGATADATVLFTRLLVIGCGLLIILTAQRYWRLLVDGITPTLLVVLVIMAFLSITLLHPLDAAWHGMSMMVLLLGTYVFIPNRFLPVLLLSLCGSVAFILVMADHFELPFKHLLIMGLLFLGLNLFGAVSAHRLSVLSRQGFRDGQILRQANQRLMEEVSARKQLEQDLVTQVHHDELTGVTNRRRFLELARQRMREAEASGQALSLLMVDVDYFKQINDTYGHLRGDEVLKALSRICENHMDDEEVLARMGGEEFAMLLPGLDLEGARKTAEAIRASVWRTPVSLLDTAIHITVSIGVVQWRVGETLAECLRRADQTLQVAKYNGRNRVETGGQGAGQGLGLSTPASSSQNKTPAAASS
jgi:diguanylate cyclase (GGDEF)-like protein